MKFFIIVLSALAIGSYFLFASGEPRVELKIGDEAPNLCLKIKMARNTNYQTIEVKK